MDPNACILRIYDAAHALDWDEAYAALDDYADWTTGHGGFHAAPENIEAVAITLEAIASPHATTILRRLSVIAPRITMERAYS